MKSNTKPQTISPQQPHGSPADFEVLLRSSMDELLKKTKTHQESWGLGEEEQWFLDQGSGDLVFTFPNGVTSAPAQVIGAFDTQAGTWTWAWADDSVPDHLKVDALRVKDYGVQHGFRHLVVPTWPAEESHCWYMTAFACWLCQAQGGFRGVAGGTVTFVTFGEVNNAGGEEVDEETALDNYAAEAVEDFRYALENPDEQRQACCRYLKRGTMAGLPQHELIHRLGLAAPSVLDLAGYPPDLAENVMAMLKTISDEEIVDCPE